MLTLKIWIMHQSYEVHQRNMPNHMIPPPTQSDDLFSVTIMVNKT